MRQENTFAWLFPTACITIVLGACIWAYDQYGNDLFFADASKAKTEREQKELMERQVDALERIADSLEAK
jgi:hypothetical protein